MNKHLMGHPVYSWVKKSCLLAVILLTAVLSAPGGTATWDGGAALAPWSNPTNWTGDLAPSANDSLVFAGTVQLTATNDYTAGTQFNGITIASGAGAFVLGGNSINLGGNVTNLASSTLTMSLPMVLLQDTTFNTASTTGNITVNGGISGTGFDLVKTGVGTLTLGTVVSGYTGQTKVKEGALGISFASAAAGTTNLISSSSALELGGGVGASALSVSSRNTNGSANSQAFSGTTIKAGLSTVTVSRAGTTTNTMTLDLGAITREAVGVLAIVQGTNATFGTNAWVKASGTLNNGILGGWATFGNDWATLSGADVVGYTGYTVLAGAGPTMASGASTNVQVSSGSTGNVTMAASGTTDVNTLQLTDAASRTVDIGTGNTLRLGANGGVWRTSTATTSLTITGGTLTAGGVADTAGEIVFNAAGISGDTLNALNHGIIVDSLIGNNGSGAVTLIKTGNQVLRLTNASNSYSGGTYIQQGRIQSTQAGSLGGGEVTIANGAGIVLAGSGNYTNNFVVSGQGNSSRTNTSDSTTGSHGAIILNNGAEISGTVTLQGNTRISAPLFYGATGGSTGTISGKITGAYNLEMGYNANIGGGAGTITLSNTGNDWTGGLTIGGGGSSGNRVMTVVLGASEVIPDGVGFGDVNFSKGGASGGVTFSLNGFSETINGLGSTGTGSIIVQNSHASNNSTLSVGGGNASANFGGTLRNSSAGTGGTLSLSKSGTGTQELSGTATYTGTTTVSGGTLLVSGTMTGTSGVTANTGGTFRYDNNATALDRNVTISGGKFSYNSTSNYAGTLTFTSGTIGGSNISNLNLSIGTGQIMAPGNSTGTMAAGATTWATGGTFLFELNDTTGTAGSTSLGWDLLNATTLNITAGLGEFTIQIASLDSLQAAGNALNFDGSSNYTWLFVDAGATISGFNAAKFSFNDSAFLNSTPGTFSISQGTGVDDDKLYLNYTGVIPEPGTYAMLVVGLIGLWLVRRRGMKQPGV